MSTELSREPGWDAKVRTRAATHYGNLSTFASELGVATSIVPNNTWANIVEHFGTTLEVSYYLDEVGAAE
jgi:hypothetical protein